MEEEYESIKQKIRSIMYEEIEKQIQNIILRTLNLHARALIAHCECLGMNAENCWAACSNTGPIYGDNQYLAVLDKWELTDIQEIINPIKCKKGEIENEE